MSDAQGRFLTIEGIEGVGKTTQLARLSKILSDRGIAHVVTREPGGTPLAEQIRDLVLTARSEGLPDAAELLLMFAARAVHLRESDRTEFGGRSMGAVRSLHGCHLCLSGSGTRPRRATASGHWKLWCREHGDRT